MAPPRSVSNGTPKHQGPRGWVADRAVSLVNSGTSKHQVPHGWVADCAVSLVDSGTSKHQGPYDIATGRRQRRVQAQGSQWHRRGDSQLLHGGSNSAKEAPCELFFVAREHNCEETAPVRHPQNGPFAGITHHRS